MLKNKDYDIIVIGAGCGGLTAATCAAKEGKKVLLIERHNLPGGFNTSFVRGRFEFEVSLNQLCGFSDEAGLGETRHILDEIGVSNKIKWASIRNAYRIITKTRTGEIIDATLPFGIENYINAMESYVPGSKEPLKKVFNLAEEINDALDYLCKFEKQPSYRELRRIFKKYGNFTRTAPYSVNEVLSVLNLPSLARDIFEAYWLHFGVDCDRLSFTHYALFMYNTLKYGSVIPLTRSHALSMAIASEFEDAGGEILYNSHVSRIKFKNGKPVGVILKNGDMINSNHIICNCSPTTVYGKMIKSTDVPKSARKRTNARTFGARGACVYVGLNRSASELGIKDYSVIINDSSDTVEQFESMKSIETNNNVSAYCLNIINPSCSPKGTTILCLKTLYTDNCWANVSPEEYFNEKDMLAARLISAYEEATGVIIHNSIEEIEVATPVTFARFTNSPQGVIYGYLGSEWDGLLPRFMTEKTDNDIDGLRFCGGWGTQLCGTHASIASGRNTAYATLNDISEERGVDYEQ